MAQVLERLVFRIVMCFRIARKQKGVADAMIEAESSYPEIMSSLDKFQTTRMFLTAKAWLASRFTYELLSTHEIHLLYADREQLKYNVPRKLDHRIS